MIYRCYGISILDNDMAGFLMYILTETCQNIETSAAVLFRI